MFKKFLFLILILCPLLTFGQRIKRKPAQPQALPVGSQSQFIRADGTVQPLTPEALKLGNLALQKRDSVDIRGGLIVGIQRLLIGKSTYAGYALDVQGYSQFSSLAGFYNGIVIGPNSKTLTAPGNDFEFNASIKTTGNYLFADAAKSISGGVGGTLSINSGTNSIDFTSSSVSVARFNSSNLAFLRAISFPIATKTAAYTIGPGDHTILADATGAAVTIALPTAVGNAGQIYRVKRISGGANNVTVVTQGGQTIDGSTNYVLNAQWKQVTVQSDGANWFNISIN